MVEKGCYAVVAEHGEHEGWEVVLDAFGSNTTIRTVVLMNALLSDANSARSLGEMLKRNRTITTLHLESNLLSSAALEQIADGLRQNTTLSELKLANQRLAASQARRAISLTLTMRTEHYLSQPEAHHLAGAARHRRDAP